MMNVGRTFSPRRSISGRVADEVLIKPDLAGMNNGPDRVPHRPTQLHYTVPKAPKAYTSEGRRKRGQRHVAHMCKWRDGGNG